MFHLSLLTVATLRRGLMDAPGAVRSMSTPFHPIGYRLNGLRVDSLHESRRRVLPHHVVRPILGPLYIPPTPGC